jgi:hypothetical protein
MKRFGVFLVAAAVAIAAWVTLRRARERAMLEEEWEAETPAAVGVDEAMAEAAPLFEDAEADDAAVEEVVVEEVQVAISEPATDDDEATFVTFSALVPEEVAEEAAAAAEEEVPFVVEAPREEVDEETQEAPPLHTDREMGELRDQIAESRKRMRDKARTGRPEQAEPEAGEPEGG